MSDGFHPIEGFEHLVELVQVLERLAGVMEAQTARTSELVALQRGLSENGILWSGAVKVAPGATTHKSFQAPFACLYVADLSGLGPIYVANDTVDDVLAEQPGVGRWKVPASGAELIPFTGSECALTSTTAGICYLAAFSKAAIPVLGPR